jgi:putative endonuclease
MPATYILKSQSTGKFYVGSALDLKQRIAEHHRGRSPYTKNRGPWVLVYEEEYATLALARRRIILEPHAIAG